MEKNVKLSEIIPYENNPRKNDDAVASVAESIKQCGYIAPIIVDENMVVLAGHTRLRALKKLGYKEVTVKIVDDLTEEQKKKYRLLDNKTNEIAEWDIDKLKEELDGLDFGDFDFGFDLGDDEDETEAKEDDYEVVVPEEPKSKLGQVYKLGNHRLMCGDSTKAEDVKKLCGGEMMDLLITDPPYNVAIVGGSHGESIEERKKKGALSIENDSMGDEDFHNFLKGAFSNAYEVLKPGACFYVWYASKEVVNFQSALEESELSVKQELIWNKTSLVMGRQDYQWKHEPCLYGWKEGAGHLWASDRKQTTVIDMQRPTKSDLHPTMKPIPLFDYQMKNNTKGGDRVLDLFCGSGTTLMACEQNGRYGYGMEFDPKYVDVIIDRWEKFTGKKAELVEE